MVWGEPQRVHHPPDHSTMIGVINRKEGKKFMGHYYKALCDAYDPTTGQSLIEHELLTKRERYFYFAGLTDANFKEVIIPRSKTFNSFGCRFIINDPDRS